MLCIPITTPGNQNDIVIVILDDTSIERMAKADPAQVVTRVGFKKLVNPSILICHEKATPELMRLVNAGDLPKLFEFLQRGFEFRPDQGDHDNGPQKLYEGN